MFSSNTSQVSNDVNYIEDVFSNFLYSGNGSTQTITNGIDLAGKGGLVWSKGRSSGLAGVNHWLSDTARGIGYSLASDSTAAQSGPYNYITLNASGYSLNTTAVGLNTSGETYASWTFRKQPKFFDVVTYTGNDTARSISHSLGSVPGCIIIKCTSHSTTDWVVYHRSNGATKWMKLNGTDAVATNATYFPTNPDATSFNIGNGGLVNSGGRTFVAYLFAHNAGGFGLTGTDNVISCGSFTTDGSGNATVNIGYEPQWTITKRTDSSGVWSMNDVMRGMPLSSGNQLLEAQSSAAESTGGQSLKPNATGFTVTGSNASATFIYIAIRRGPMKTPTTGTSVFAPLARTGTGTNPTVVTSGTNPDLLMSFPRTASPAAYGTVFFDKLRGVSQILQSANTNAEATTAGTFCLQGFLNTGFQTGADFIEGYLNYSGSTYAQYLMTRAPGFFDVVCYTGTGSATTFSHNLTVAPELMIVKRQNSTGGWDVYADPLGNTGFLQLNTTAAVGSSTGRWNATTPTNSVFSVGTAGTVNTSGGTYVAYLFASAPGVSKVGSYTGTGTTQQINCGFTAGARLVLIKRTDSTGDWYVWDSARGIVAGNDPYLLLNSTAAEVTSTDYVDTFSSGFEISSTAPAAINASGGTFIYLAIA